MPAYPVQLQPENQKAMRCSACGDPFRAADHPPVLVHTRVHSTSRYDLVHLDPDCLQTVGIDPTQYLATTGPR